MAISRIAQGGAEWGDILLEVTARDGSGTTASTTVAKTGTYSFRSTGSSGAGFWWTFTATSQLRVGFHFRPSPPDSGDSPGIVALQNGSTNVASVRFDEGNDQFQLYIGGVQQATHTKADFAGSGNWFHIGIDAKIDASGWAYVYLDGQLIMSFTGDTTGGAADVDRVEFNQFVSISDSWSSAIYYDDIFIDDTTGEASASVVPDLRFDFILADTESATINWTPSTGTDNAALVDERPPDDDTTYVSAGSASLDDLYNLDTYTLPSGFSLDAVILGAVAKKTDGGVDTELALLLDDGTNTTVIAAQNLATAYGLLQGREENAPDGAAWSQAKLNGATAGIRSAGSFS